MPRLFLLLIIFANIHLSCTAMQRRPAPPTQQDEESALIPVGDGDCSVCFDLLTGKESIATPGCGGTEGLHQFHVNCLKEWTQTGEEENHKRCPLCRTQLPAELLPQHNECPSCFGFLIELFWFRFPE